MLANVQKRQQAAKRAQCWPILCHEVQCRHLGDAAIERIRTEFALCAAPLDAILAEIAWEATAFETSPSPHCPTSYVDAVLSTMGGGTQPSLPLALSPSALAPAALPLPANSSRYANVPDLVVALVNATALAHPVLLEGPPSHPHQMLDGLQTPTSTTLARATSLCRMVVSSTTPSSMAPPTPSLQPFTFLGDVVRYSSGGGATYPFRASSPPWKRTRRKPRTRRVCRRHGHRAPNQVEPLLCGRRHRPRAPNQSTRDGWD